MERLRKLGLRLPISELRGTYLGEAPRELIGLTESFILACNVRVRRTRNRVIVWTGEITAYITIPRRSRGILQVLQATLDNPEVVQVYPLYANHQLSFERGIISLEWSTGEDGNYERLADLPLCIDLIEALVAAESS